MNETKKMKQVREKLEGKLAIQATWENQEDYNDKSYLSGLKLRIKALSNQYTKLCEKGGE